MVYEVELRGEEWFMISGLIGLKRLYGDEIRQSKNGVYISSEMLDTLSNRYFRYFLDTYSVVRRDTKRMNKLLSLVIKKTDTAKERMFDIRKIATEQLKKVEKYFSETIECKQLRELVEQMKECKKSEHLDIMQVYVQKYQEIMSSDFIEEKLTLNYSKAVIISPFYGQPSFLQASCNILNLKQHIEKMNKDFIINAKLELQLQEYLYTSDNPQEVHEFLQKNSQYSIFKNWYKEIKKINDIEEIQLWFKENILPCTFIDYLPSTMSYEEMMFSPLGLSKEKASNFYWDFNKKTPIPMSALTRLILFLIPVGTAFYQRKLGSSTSSEYKQFAGVVIQDSNFIENFKANETYRNIRQIGGSYNDIIVGLLTDTQERSKRKTTSFLFVELHSDYQSKKTLLDYYHMPLYVTIYFSKYENSLKLLYSIEQRESFVRSVLSGKDPKQAIFEYLRIAVTDNHHGLGAYIATRERQRLQLLKKGVIDMDIKKHDKLVYVVFSQGKEIRNIMLGRDSIQNNAIYQAPNKKKVDSIAYRLLNEVKSGNKQNFLETVFRLHIANGKEISSIFLDINKKDGLDFVTIGSSFIAGLLSADIPKKEVKSNE